MWTTIAIVGGLIVGGTLITSLFKGESTISNITGELVSGCTDGMYSIQTILLIVGVVLVLIALFKYGFGAKDENHKKGGNGNAKNKHDKKK